MRVWTTYPQVYDAIATLKKIKSQTGKFPEILIESYRETLQYSSKGLVQRFYELLAKELPEALEFFAELKKGGQSEEIHPS